MKLWINQLLQWLPKEETIVHTERVLWIDSSSIHVVTIELNNPNALPIWHEYLELETALTTGEAHILQIDPFTSLQTKEDTIPTSHRKRRDEAWKVIAPMIAAGENLYIPRERGKLIQAALHSSQYTKRTIYKYLRRYWQGGQTPNTLLPLFDRCGGRGKERSCHNSKRGRPRVSTPDIVRLNLLPTGTATVTDRGIRFEKLFYSCELAAREQWFVKARVGKTWKITVAYDPRNLDKIYLPLDGGFHVEVCQLLDTCQTFKGKDWYEAIDYWTIQKLARTEALSSAQQAQASVHAQINQIIDQATELLMLVAIAVRSIRHKKVNRLRLATSLNRKKQPS